MGILQGRVLIVFCKRADMWVLASLGICDFLEVRKYLRQIDDLTTLDQTYILLTVPFI
jgi:hypothetical protein